MKKNNKNKETKQRVRVLETGELGTVTDQQLIPRGGKLHRYVQVRLDGRPHLDRWFWDDQLGGTQEKCRATFENENGQQLIYDITMDHEKDGDMTVVLSARNPDLLIKHNGLHMQMAALLMDGFKAEEKEIE